MTAKVLNRGRFGWAIEFPGGFVSAMPDASTARQCVAAADLLAACERLVSVLGDWSHIEDSAVKDALHVGRAAIAKAQIGSGCDAALRDAKAAHGCTGEPCKICGA